MKDRVINALREANLTEIAERINTQDNSSSGDPCLEELEKAITACHRLSGDAKMQCIVDATEAWSICYNP